MSWSPALIERIEVSAGTRDNNLSIETVTGKSINRHMLIQVGGSQGQSCAVVDLEGQANVAAQVHTVQQIGKIGVLSDHNVQGFRSAEGRMVYTEIRSTITLELLQQ